MTSVPKYRSPVSLVPGGGLLQFLDFSLELEKISKLQRVFHEELRKDSDIEGRHNNILCCLKEDDDGVYIDMLSGKPTRYGYDINAKNCLANWTNTWIPLPILRIHDQKWKDDLDRFEYGPSNWARAKIMPSDDDDQKLHITLAFDCNVEDRPEDEEYYYALSPKDVSAHATFKLATHIRDNAWFLNLAWVDDWLFGLWEQRQKMAKGMRDQSEYVLEYLASYLTLLEIIQTAMQDLVIQVVNPERDIPIDVDLILDIGNSRSTGILVETLPQRMTNLNDSYLIQIRDMDNPQHIYREPFETRIEFAEVSFGNDALSRRSGRKTLAFIWPSCVRLGPEAARLSTYAVRAEGTTGMSSPKRYLWDERPWQQSWRYNTKGGQEPMVTRGLLPQKVNREGTPISCFNDPLFTRNPRLNKQEKEIAFESLYTRSSLMMFMMIEIIMHALTTINSPAQRSRRELPNLPRRLRRVIFTVPSGMPIAEQRIYQRWVNWSVKVLWETLGWKDYYLSAQEQIKNTKKDYRLNPIVRCDWDEATCTQLVYLYNELTRKFQGDAHHLFSMIGKNRPNTNDKLSIRMATIDIGGGTTDLSITTFLLENEISSSTRIKPQLEFRDGFNIAGDDILLEVVKEHILPAIGEFAVSMGAHDSKSLLGELFGRDTTDNSQENRINRTQFARQIGVPVALALLAIYENSPPMSENTVIDCTFGNFFLHEGDKILNAPQFPSPGKQVIEYVEKAIYKHMGSKANPKDAPISFMHIPIAVRPLQIGETIRAKMAMVLTNLCEAIHAYDCDLLLLTGRPSRWHAIVNAIFAKLPVPPSRILPMSTYNVGKWYPFADSLGHITDPKTTVVVGAILCALAEGHLEGFSFDTNCLKLQSTARFIGEMNTNGQIINEKVWFNIDINDKEMQEYRYKGTFSGPIAVGFRQLEIQRWTTTRFYLIDFANEDLRRKAAGRLPYTLSLCFNINEIEENSLKEQRDEGDLIIEEITDKDGNAINKRDLEIRLQTLPLDEGYWLDTGTIYNDV